MARRGDGIYHRGGATRHLAPVRLRDALGWRTIVLPSVRWGAFRPLRHRGQMPTPIQLLGATSALSRVCSKRTLVAAAESPTNIGERAHSAHPLFPTMTVADLVTAEEADR